MELLTPIVKVIAYSHPFGDLVPTDLRPEDSTQISAKHQDEGSNGARIIECAGRTCYDSYGLGRPSSEYHQHIKEVGHGSVAEHVSISFYLDNLSRGCTHELVRHRAGVAISQRSTRYVDESRSPYILHPLLKLLVGDDETESVVDAAMYHARAAYVCIVRKLEATLASKGIDKQTARKQARGAARGMLGNALCTSMVWTANIRALRGCIEQRASPHADAEIRVLYNTLYEKAIAVVPEYFDDYERVECPDGVGYGLITKYRKI